MDTAAAAAFDSKTFLTMAKPFRLQWEAAQGRYVILYPEGMVKLNQAAGLILNHCCLENKSIGQTIDDLAKDFDQDPDSMLNDVQEFVRIAYENRWIEQRQ